ncbi:hypothetical protein VNO78_23629 [Psophocarpus tetragonolobus]|uniref:Uncharacterized protein n=1 Tax=Psophocarpus tetragonolobus TaxID=3891 RepID=A0AAN9S400_PSOTE
MATPALSSIVQPEQQQEAVAGTTASTSGSAWQSSGSVGPFFAVMTVLIILAVLSCYLGRKWNPRPKTPLESITGRGFSGWLKRAFSERFTKDTPVGGVGAKVYDAQDLSRSYKKISSQTIKRLLSENPRPNKTRNQRRAKYWGSTPD